MATLCTLRGVSDPSLVEPEIAAMEVTCRYNIYCISTAYLHIYISTYLHIYYPGGGKAGDLLGCLLRYLAAKGGQAAGPWRGEAHVYLNICIFIYNSTYISVVLYIYIYNIYISRCCPWRC